MQEDLDWRQRRPVTDVANVVAVLDDAGHDVDPILESVGISRASLDNAANHVAESKYCALVDHTLAELGVQGLGLLQARKDRHMDRGFLGAAFFSSATLGEAIGTVSKYQRVAGVPGSFYLSRANDDAAIVCTGVENRARHIWSIEWLLGTAARYIRTGIGAAALFSSVRLAYGDPGYGHLYRSMFSCPVYFSETRNELRFARRLLDQPMLNANPAMRELSVRQCRRSLSRQDPGKNLRQEVEAMILAAPSLTPTLESVAHEFGMTGRTLARRLAETGTSFRDLLRQVRARLAHEYLVETTLAPKQVAHRLGYSSHTNFYAAFRQWHGCTPRQYRQQYG